MSLCKTLCTPTTIVKDGIVQLFTNLPTVPWWVLTKYLRDERLSQIGELANRTMLKYWWLSPTGNIADGLGPSTRV